MKRKKHTSAIYLDGIGSINMDCFSVHDLADVFCKMVEPEISVALLNISLEIFTKTVDEAHQNVLTVKNFISELLNSINS
ncbi:MAG: hypothetical protein EA359_17140 [Balneolaceae bacterium]|nr:MAG: hypothetical protein EA359_17140 [Balneolaceae bacterium]